MGNNKLGKMSCLQFLGETYYFGRKRIGAFVFGKRKLDNLDGKEIIIWGTGELAHRCYNYISGKVMAFCDNNSSHWGKKFMGLPILNPNDAFKQNPYFIICANGWSLWLVSRQILARHGDDFGFFFLHSYGDYFDSPDLFEITIQSANIILSNEFYYGNVSAWHHFVEEKEPLGMPAEICLTTEFWDTTLNWLSAMPKPKKLLDIGPGWGLFSAILNNIWNGVETYYLCFGDEREREKDVLYKELKKFDITKIYGFVENPSFDIEEKFDLILFTEVFEHFSCNPVPTLKKITGWLTDSGVLAFTTPTPEADPLHIYDSYKEMSAFGDEPLSEYLSRNVVARRFIDPSTGHVHIYTKTELDEIFAICGLHIFKYDVNAIGRHNFLLKKNL